MVRFPSKANRPARLWIPPSPLPTSTSFIQCRNSEWVELSLHPPLHLNGVDNIILTFNLVSQFPKPTAPEVRSETVHVQVVVHTAMRGVRGPAHR